jgi:hypothetical protein
MNDGPSYLPAFELGAQMEGGAVGEVVASRSDTIPVGATVSHFLGWREYAVVDATQATVLDTTIAPPQAYLARSGRRDSPPTSPSRRSPRSVPATWCSCREPRARSAAWPASWPAPEAPRG